MGEFVPDIVGYLVDKVQHRPGLAAFVLSQCLALITLAIPIPIVLGDRDNACLRILAQLLTHPVCCNFDYLWIGQAKLRLLARTLPINLGEVFRMILKILLGRDQAIESMHEALVGYVPAVFLLQVGEMAV